MFYFNDQQLQISYLNISHNGDNGIADSHCFK